MNKSLFILVFLFLLLISRSWSHEYLQSNSFLDVQAKIESLREQHGAQSVLVVLDIDNTLLKARQTFGSDQWFDWQAEAIKQQSPEALFGSLEELIKAHVDIFQLSTMQLTESMLPKLVAELKAQGHSLLLLTSRGPEVRNATERELENNGLWFADHTIMPGIPHSLHTAPFKNPVSFMNGIFMTSGHHKGEALQFILNKAQKKYKAIIFVDDLEKHTRRVYDSFASANSADSDTEIITFRYGHEDPAVTAFKTSDKKLVWQQTKALFDLIQQSFR